MADDNLTVKFSVDTSNLTSGIQAASKQVSASTDQMRLSANQAKEMFDKFGTDLSKVKLPLNELDGVAKQVSQNQKALADGVNKTGEAFKLAGPGIGFYARELHAMVDELASNRMNQLHGTITNVIGTFAAANPALGGMVIAITALSAALASSIYQFHVFNEELNKIKLNDAFMGLKSQSDSFTRSIILDFKNIQDTWTSIFTGLSTKDAAEIFTKLSVAVNGNTTALDIMKNTINLWGKTFKASGDEVKAFAEGLIKAGEAAKSPEAAMRAIEDVNKGWTASERNAMEAVLAKSDSIERQSLIIEANARAALRAAEEKKRIAMEEAILEAENLYRNEITSTSLENEAKHQYLLKEATDKVNIVFENQAKAQNALIASLKDRVKTSQEVIKVAGQELSTYESVSEKLATLQGKASIAQNGIAALTVELQKDPTNSANIQKLKQLTEQFEILKNAIASLQAVLSGGTDYTKLTNDLDLLAQEGRVATREILSAKLKAEDIYRNEDGRTAKEIQESNERTRKLQSTLLGEDLKDFEYSSRMKIIAADGDSQKIIKIKQDEISKLKSLGYDENSDKMRSAVEALEQAKNSARRAGAKESERINSEETKAALANLDAEMEKVKDAGNTKEISRQEELQQLIALENQKLQVILESINNETKSEREKNALIEKAEAESARNRAKIRQQLDRQMIAEEKAMASEITNSFMGTASSVLKGQMTLKQGLLQIGEQILTAQIKQYATAFFQKTLFSMRGKAVDEGIKSADIVSTQTAETAKTTATIVGEEERVAATQAGASSGLLAKAAAMIKSIISSAAETFAGVFGFLSPVMGPAAAGPAAASQATVAAVAGSVPSFAIGAWELPSDTMAMVHRKEMIIPATPAEQIRDFFTNFDAIMQKQALNAQLDLAAAGLARLHAPLPRMVMSPSFMENASGSHQSPVLRQIAQKGESDLSSGSMAQQGGGDTHHHDNRTFHIGFIDTNGAAAFLKAHGDKLAKTVSERQNLNPSLRGKW